MADTPARNPDYPTFAECLEMGVYVPPMIGEIEAECGHAALVAFLLRWGGQEIHIAKTSAESGAPAAAVLNWLRSDIGYGRWAVPRALVSDRTVIRWHMLRRLRAGQTLSQVAHGVGCTTRSVSNRKTDFTRRGLLPALSKQPSKEQFR